MTVRSHMRGHPVEWSGGLWLWSGTRVPVTTDRPCVRCGRMPTPEGYDACVGHVEDAVSVCCGHGVSEPILRFPDTEQEEDDG